MYDTCALYSIVYMYMHDVITFALCSGGNMKMSVLSQINRVGEYYVSYQNTVYAPVHSVLHVPDLMSKARILACPRIPGSPCLGPQ